MLYVIILGFVAVFIGGVFAHNAIMAEIEKLQGSVAAVHATAAKAAASSAATAKVTVAPLSVKA